MWAGVNQYGRADYLALMSTTDTKKAGQFADPLFYCACA
ncbi:hypothetical protein [Citrobacter pasteurii]|nr:hypothetical protein [Citrobacter pasteurii]